VRLVLASHALTFDDFRNYVIGQTDWDEPILAVARTWRM
jgi:hypothetical protein